MWLYATKHYQLGRLLATISDHVPVVGAGQHQKAEKLYRRIIMCSEFGFLLRF